MLNFLEILTSLLQSFITKLFKTYRFKYYRAYSKNLLFDLFRVMLDLTIFLLFITFFLVKRKMQLTR